VRFCQFHSFLFVGVKNFTNLSEGALYDWILDAPLSGASFALDESSVDFGERSVYESGFCGEVSKNGDSSFKKAVLDIVKSKFLFGKRDRLPITLSTLHLKLF